MEFVYKIWVSRIHRLIILFHLIISFTLGNGSAIVSIDFSRTIGNFDHVFDHDFFIYFLKLAQNNIKKYTQYY